LSAGISLPEEAAEMVDEPVVNSPEQLEVDVSVKDGGMMLVTALTPDLRWQSGAAELALSVRGIKSSPQVCLRQLLMSQSLSSTDLGAHRRDC